MTFAETWNSPYEWSLAFVMLAAAATTAALAYLHGYLRGMPTVFRIPIDTLIAVLGVSLHGQFHPHTAGWAVLLGCSIAGISYRIAGSMSQLGVAVGDRSGPKGPNDPKNNDPDP